MATVSNLPIGIPKNINQGNAFLAEPNEILSLIFSFLQKNKGDVIAFGKQLCTLKQVCVRFLQVTNLPVFAAQVESAMKNAKVLKDLKALEKRDASLMYFDFPGSNPC